MDAIAARWPAQTERVAALLRLDQGLVEANAGGRMYDSSRRALFGLLAGIIASLLLLDTASDHGGWAVHEHGVGPLAGARAALAQASVFLFTFDGAPAAPQAWRPTDWDVQVHHNELLFWKQFPPTSAVHGANCSAPPGNPHRDEPRAGSVHL